MARSVVAPRRLLFAVTLALLGGQLLGGVAHALLLAGAIAVAAAGAVATRHSHGTWIAVCLCAAAIGIVQVDALLTPQLPFDHIVHSAGATLDAFGRVTDCTRDAAGRTRITLDIDWTSTGGPTRPARGQALVTIATATLPWQPGDRARARLRFRRPRNFGNPGEFDYEAFLARRRIYVTAFAMSDAAWERHVPPPARQSVVTRWRGAIRAVLQASLEGVAQRITAALIIGDSASLPPPLWERYARTGVAHVLSISGLHITLVATGGYGVARWILSRSTWLLLSVNVPKLSMSAAIVPVAAYGLLAGGSAPTLRAITVIAVLGLGMVLDRRRDWLTSLAAAAFAISALWPGSIFEIAFQLSFMSVLAIMLGMPPMVARWRAWEEAHLIHLRSDVWRWRALRWIVLSLATTVCAAVGTAPLTAYHFNQISLITLVANLIVVPLLGMVPISAGLLASLCVPVAPGVAVILFRIGGVFIECADLLVTLLAQVPGAAVRTVTPTIFELALLYGTLGSAVLLTGRQRAATLLLCGVLLVGDGAYWCWERFRSDRLRVTFLSVGQGDCAIVELPGSHVMVIDGGGLGGTFDVGERVVAPYLWRRKVHRIDWLVLSHAEHDHYGGLAFLARAFAPRELWWNGIAGTGDRLREFWSVVARHDIPARSVGRGFSIRVDGVDLDVLAPEASDGGSLNDQSMVLRLRYGPTALLFTGDIEAQGERRLIERSASEIRAQILKAPHHGSRTSSSHGLLSHVDPHVAVVSAGFANRFRMPHAEVLARYAARGVALWRTDVHGAVVVTVSADGTIAVRGSRR